MPDYRKTTEKERKTLELSRDLMRQGIEGEQDILTKFSPMLAQGAKRDISRAKALRESVPLAAREGEAYDYAGYKKGGKVSASRRADGIAKRGKTKGRMV